MHNTSLADEGMQYTHFLSCYMNYQLEREENMKWEEGESSNHTIYGLVPSPLPQNGCCRLEDDLGSCNHFLGAVTSEGHAKSHDQSPLCI